MVLRHKTKNCHGDFDAQITKSELPILRPKPGNPPPPWFWGSTKKPTADFEVKSRETVVTIFEVKLEKTVVTGFKEKPAKTIATGFEARPVKTIAAGFEAKLLETVRVVLRPNHSQNVDLGFKSQPRNSRS
jgi:hypothetical protein